jgi:hypothetical protein
VGGHGGPGLEGGGSVGRGGNILGSGEEGRGLTGADQHQKREWGTVTGAD